VQNIGTSLTTRNRSMPIFTRKDEARSGISGAAGADPTSTNVVRCRGFGPRIGVVSLAVQMG